MNMQTLRAIGGATSPAKIAPSETALLVIDFQNEYFNGRLPIPSGMDALNNAKRLIAHADRLGIAVYYVQHMAPAGSPIFATDGDTIRFHPDIEPGANHTVIQKSQVSVFQGTGIEAQLRKANINTLIITGLMTHACVAGAARDAAPIGYEVLVAADACATRDILNHDNTIVPHQDLHRSSLVALSDTFTTVLNTDEILAL